ncbi:oxidoreductase [Pedobacter sp. UYP1]|jgi:NAD(P)-dependent dehydrogenase (short-subunit alcohol dehydrogenase family)|uniref:oxidoreductase n=1 Tax=Pedobacter sp. UYP1 TaxID=1756396 RepID=UPI0033945311
MNKVVLITGASAGMGKETVKLLLQKGYTVYGAARRIENMQDIASLGARILQMDVTDEESMVKGVNEIINTEGRIDILINNAGFGSYGAVEDVPIQDARYQMEVNVFGVARLSQLVIPFMRENQYGKILNISSIGGKFALPLGGWYHASKFALEGLSDSMRNELKPFGIDVIVIEPGGVKSEWAGVAMANLMKISGQDLYRPMAQKFVNLSVKLEPKSAGPIVIAELMLKAIEAKKPKFRYVGGYLATPTVLLRKLLPDRIFDQLTMSQIK